MEKKRLCPENFRINLKHLPPIHPPINTPTFLLKYEKPISRNVLKVWKPRPKEEIKMVDQFEEEPRKSDSLKVEDANSFCSTKYMDPNSTKINTKQKETSGTKVSQTEATNKGVPKKVSAKSQLYEICSANKWKSPLFECCNEEGPCHMKLYTVKVIVEIEEALNLHLECFGAPWSKKKTAAEHAAEGALWYLKHLGYFPISK